MFKRALVANLRIGGLRMNQNDVTVDWCQNLLGGILSLYDGGECYRGELDGGGRQSMEFLSDRATWRNRFLLTG